MPGSKIHLVDFPARFDLEKSVQKEPKKCFFVHFLAPGSKIHLVTLDLISQHVSIMKKGTKKILKECFFFIFFGARAKKI